MIQVATITLENEMDLILAHRKSMRIAEKLGLTIATQTTFATAVSEISRSVIEYTDNGNLEIGLEQNKQRYNLVAVVSFDNSVKLTDDDEGFYYAQKLLPEFNITESGELSKIEMKLGLPRSLRLDRTRIAEIQKFFRDEPPINAYEEIKKRNVGLHKLAWEQEEELKRSRLIDEKKNEFISIASHEIKTPITVIKAYTQIVKASKDQCSDRVKQILDKVDHQSTKLILLVQQLLDVSKMENGELIYSMKSIDLNPFISEMVSVMKHITPDHEITTSLACDIDVKIDKLRMEQVFSNLIGNAAKYSERNTVIKLSSVLEDGFVKISITDQGIGMSPRVMKSIFDKFYRSEEIMQTHPGLGMGLYITSKIITDHGGKIWVESTENAGSTFFFTIPYELESAAGN